MPTTHGMKGTPEYRSWQGMLARCRNPKATGYKNWGGRGITVCKEWHSFINFFKDMGKRPKGKVLERKDNDLGYYPENCSWKSWEEQANNRRSISCGPCEQKWFVAGHIKSRRIFKSNNQHKFALEHGLTREAISACLRGKAKVHKGWRFCRLSRGCIRGN